MSDGLTDNKYRERIMSTETLELEGNEVTTENDFSEDAPMDNPENAVVDAIPEETRRTVSEVLNDLNKPVPERLLKKFKKGGTWLTYIPWYNACRLLDHHTRGFWNYEIAGKEIVDGSVIITVTINLDCADGNISRDGIGIESLSKTGFGDPFTSAESQAFRRALAKCGLGLHLYYDPKD